MTSIATYANAKDSNSPLDIAPITGCGAACKIDPLSGVIGV